LKQPHSNLGRLRNIVKLEHVVVTHHSDLPWLLWISNW